MYLGVLTALHLLPRHPFYVISLEKIYLSEGQYLKEPHLFLKEDTLLLSEGICFSSS